MTRQSCCASRLAVGACLLIAIPSWGADLFVDASSGNDANDGLSWATARLTVGSALSTASGTPEADAVSVATGRYLERITMPANVALLGGFPSGGGARDPTRFPTTLDAAALGRVVYFPPGSDGTVLDGFVITRGIVRRILDWDGGGILVEDAAPLIRGNVIELNGTNEGQGGGIMIRYTTARAPARVEDNLIRGNIAVGLGGSYGALKVSAAIDMDLGPILVGNRIVGNSSSYGIDVALSGRTCAMTDNIIEENSGGLELSGSWTLTNVLVARNDMNRNGRAGISLYSPGITRLDNVTVAANRIGVVVGPSRCSGSDVQITDSIIWGNTNQNLSWDASCPPPTVISSIVGGGYSGGVNIIDADPHFAPGPLGDFYLSQLAAGQPATSPGVDAGDQDAVTRGLDGRTTATTSSGDAGILDLGYHYEFAPLTILRGTRADALAVHATVAGLPFIDTPGTLSDPALPLVFYVVPETDNDIAVDKDIATDSIRLSFMMGP